MLGCEAIRAGCGCETILKTWCGRKAEIKPPHRFRAWGFDTEHAVTRSGHHGRDDLDPFLYLDPLMPSDDLDHPTAFGW
ncbi:Protein of unknown function [Pyronema omphalodes CBS 100304]|uniref:Uncharacterized protein n=1 Tax=Pyronema omphalodes (strain CBS 100304) TaxID=1076935 RepID=U4LPB1_PYROM|nr:Protein of unknown function [Pyronema omphalodes CBS 100304]